ncbi:hypothetical protein EV182_008955, partial [Spiromyces aspiralis]
MSEVKVSMVVLFDGSNYPLWKSHVLLKFMIKGLLDLITIDPAKSLTKFDLIKDVEARILILDHVHPSMDHLVHDESTAYSMWTKLEQIFSKVMISSVMEVYAEFAQAKLGPDENINDLTERITAAYRKLKELDYTLEDFQILSLLHALPSSFEATITSI